MDKNFLFINLSIECGYNSGVNHGIAYLAPIVKKHSYNVACLNIRDEISSEEFLGKVDDFKPSIVGFSSTSHQLKYLVKYSKELEKYSQVLQIAGGVASTLDPEWILSQSVINGACVGEGEIPIDNLLNNIENKHNIFDTEAFFWRINGKIKKNPVPQFMPDLSVLAFPDYSIFERDIVTYERCLLVMLSRGCPYNCYYCCNNTLQNVYPSSRGYFRIPSVEYSIELLERLVSYYTEIEFIEFEDDLLIANKTWFASFAQEYYKKINIPYRICARAECVTEDIVKVLKHSGCRRVFLGLESGNEKLRNNLLNRKYSNSLLVEKCRMIKTAGLELFTFNIVGFPFESRREMEDTFKLNKKIGPNNGVCTFFYPYKGTELYKICRESDLLKSDDEIIKITNYNTIPSIKMTTAQEKNCIDIQRKLSLYFVKQRELTQLNSLPPGIKKGLFIVSYQIRLILSETPLLYKIVKQCYRLFGIRRITEFFIKIAKKFLKLLRIVVEILISVLTKVIALIMSPWHYFRVKRFYNYQNEIKQILIVFMAEGLGDCIIFSGVLPAIRERFKSAKISLLIFQRFNEYFQGNPYIDQLLTYSDYRYVKYGLGNFLAYSRYVKQHCTPDIIIDPLPNKFMKHVFLNCLIPNKLSIGFDYSIKKVIYDIYIRNDIDKYIYDLFFDILRHIGIERREPRYWVPNDLPERVISLENNFTGKTIVLAPGGKFNLFRSQDYRGFKYYPELVTRLIENGFRVILVGAEYDVAPQFLAHIASNNRFINLLGKTSITELFSLVKNCADLVVCNTSGLLYVALATDVPSVFYAHPLENLKRWHPMPNSERYLVLRDTIDRPVKVEDFINSIVRITSKKNINTNVIR